MRRWRCMDYESEGELAFASLLKRGGAFGFFTL
jgi:hypothetical protein